MRHFADDGSLASFEVSNHPSPGILEAIAPPRSAATENLAPGANPAGWGVLAVIGAGALGAAALQRYRVVRGRST